MHVICPKCRTFLQKNMNCLTDNVEIFLTCRWSPALKKTRKRFFCQWSNSLWKRNLKYPNICFNFYELKYLRGLFWKNCSTRPQNIGGLKGKSKKKASLYVKFCVSYQLVLQICKKKWNWTQIITQIFSLKWLNYKKMGAVGVFRLKFLTDPFTLG